MHHSRERLGVDVEAHDLHAARRHGAHLVRQQVARRCGADAWCMIAMCCSESKLSFSPPKARRMGCMARVGRLLEQLHRGVLDLGEHHLALALALAAWLGHARASGLVEDARHVCDAGVVQRRELGGEGSATRSRGARVLLDGLLCASVMFLGMPSCVCPRCSTRWPVQMMKLLRELLEDLSSLWRAAPTGRRACRARRRRRRASVQLAHPRFCTRSSR